MVQLVARYKFNRVSEFKYYNKSVKDYMEIKQKINYALEGQFKVDIFNKDGQLIESTDWFNNFITPTGLNHIYKYNFADCFRFLSIGTSALGNTGNKDLSKPSTTGLYAPIPRIGTDIDTTGNVMTGWVGSAFQPGDRKLNLSGTYMGPWAYELGQAGMAEETTGPSYYRVWRIPYYGGNLTGDLSINEFMVSPFNSGDGALAFSRVVRPTIIPAQSFAYISYKLGVRLASNTMKYFGPGTFSTGNADISGEKLEVSGWANLSGYYRQTYHGLCWMDINGDTFIPKYGNLMEPSFTGFSNSRFYLSPDNGMFDVSLNGKVVTNEQDAYKADGLLKFINEIPFVGALETYPSQIRTVKNASFQSYPTNAILPKNIRLKVDDATNTKFPDIQNYKNTLASPPDFTSTVPLAYNYTNYSTATPGASGLDSNAAQFGNKAIFSTKMGLLPINTGLYTGRTRTITRRHSFMPSRSLGKNTRYGSLVYAYKVSAGSSDDYYPMIDCQFIDSSGQYMMAHYRQITGIYFTNRGSGIIEAYAYTLPEIDKPFIHKTFQGPGTGDLNQHPAIPQPQ